MVQSGKIGKKRSFFDINEKDFIALGGSPMLAEYKGSMQQLLANIYPDFDWNFDLNKSKGLHYRKSQAMLKTMLKKIFPQEGKKTNRKKSINI